MIEYLQQKLAESNQVLEVRLRMVASKYASEQIMIAVDSIGIIVVEGNEAVAIPWSQVGSLILAR